MNFDEEKYSRLRAIYTDEKLAKFADFKIVVFGLGGVGSFCTTSLARSGVGHLVLVDFDKIEESNINRQEFANEKTVGKLKVDVAKEFVGNINPDIQIAKFSEKVTERNLDSICEGANFLVDAIDDVPAKIAIAKFAEKYEIPLISCMGTALRSDPFAFKFDDIYNTSVCPLCKRVRKLSKEAGIKKLQVLYSTEAPLKTLTGDLGSTSYLPPIAGLMLSSYILKSL